ncbi:MAG: response regulator transcription factor [Aquabacterium sp.]
MSLLRDVPTGLLMAAAPARQPADPALSTSVPRMVLCAGPTLAPGETLGADDPQRRWRHVHLPDPSMVHQTLSQVAFDAVLLEHEALEPTPAVLLSRLRAQTACPIIVLTRRADEVDEIVALEHGADRFLIRPLSPRRLRAHLSAAWRAGLDDAGTGPTRHAAAVDAPVAGWSLDGNLRRLQRQHETIPLTAALFALARRLMCHAGRVVDVPELLAALHSAGAEPDPAHVAVYIHRLRRRLSGSGLRIDALRGSGFVLMPDAGSATA